MSNLFTELQAEQERQQKLVKHQQASRSPIEKPKQPTDKQSVKRAQVHRPTGARTHTSIYARVRKAVSNRSLLSGFTFRYKLQELKRLDNVTKNVNESQDVKVSKNDVVRIALNWLLEDHEDNKRASVLSKTIARLRR